MSDKNIKAMRGQIRQIIKELLPEILTQELSKTLETRVDNKVEHITNMVRQTLEKLDSRSKDMQQYVVRNVGVPTAPTTPVSEGPAPASK